MGQSFPFSVVFAGVDRLSGPLGKAEGRLARFGAKATDVGKRLTLGVTAPIVGFGALTIRTASQFEFGMNRVRALTGATAEEMALLEEQSKSLGRTTQFSATDSAEAQRLFAQAGFRTNEILSATPAVLNLAAAGALELGSAAEIAAITLRGYGKDASELVDVTDTLAAVQSKSLTDVTQLGEAFGSAGPVAKAAGLEFTETAAILGKMADGGFQASLGGTALRGSIARLLNPSRQAQQALLQLGITRDDVMNDQGGIKDFTGLIQKLGEQGATAGDLLLIFGQRAGPAITNLVQGGADSIRQLVEEIQPAGQAAFQAGINMEGARGGMLALKSAFEGLQIAIADSGLLESFTSLVRDNLTPFVQRLAESDPKLLKMVTSVALLAAALGPLLLVLGQTGLALSGFIQLAKVMGPLLGSLSKGLLTKLVPAVWSFTTALLANPIGATIAGIVALVAAVVLLWKNWDWVVGKLTQAWDFLKKAFFALVDLWLGQFKLLASFLPDWVKKRIGLGGGDVSVEVEGSEVAAAATSIAGSENFTTRDARVAVSFEDVPAGARVRAEGDQPVDLDVGHAMAPGL